MSNSTTFIMPMHHTQTTTQTPQSILNTEPIHNGIANMHQAQTTAENIHNYTNGQSNIFIAAAGTGGHVFPGIAIAQELQKLEHNIYWIGVGGLEQQWVNAAHLPYYIINFSGVRSKGLMRLLKLPFDLIKAVKQAKKLLKDKQAKLVLVMGGYVSVPVAIAAKLLGIPVIVHEQNSIAGSANKLAHLMAAQTLVAFKQSLTPSTYVGNPIRKEIIDMDILPNIEERYEDFNRPIKLLVLGGSLGAQILNELVPQALAKLSPEKRPQVVHQSGKKHIEQLKKNYADLNLKGHTTDFINQIGEAYAWADVVICRAGAMTISELSTVGVPAIFVPYPHAIDDHQTKNTQHLVDAKAAWCIPQSKLTVELLAELLQTLNLATLKQMAFKAQLHTQKTAAYDAAMVCHKTLQS